MKWTVFASMEQKSFTQVSLLPTWIFRAGLGTWGKGDLQCQGSGWWIWRSKREPVNSPEVWTLPKTCEMSTTSCLLLFGESKLRGWPAGTVSVAVAGLCQRADLPKDFPHVHSLRGRPSARRIKDQVPRGNIKLSIVTWMRLGKANQADAQCFSN